MSATVERKPLVSIVTPARDAAATLGRTLDSVARQDLVAWEHLIVTAANDHATAGVVRDRAGHDDRVVLRQASVDTAGQGRNVGLGDARGEFVLFLDADDTIAPAHLSRLVRAARRRDAGIVLSGYRRLGPDGRSFQMRHPRGWVGADVIADGPPSAFHAMLFRRDLLKQVGGFDAALRTNEDWDLCLRALEAGARFYATGDCTADYWTGPGSLTSNGVAMIRDRRTVARRAATVTGGGDDGGQRCARDGLATLLWAGAAALARGQDVRPLLAELAENAPYPPLAIEAEHAADALLDGLTIGFVCGYADVERRLDGRWPDLATFVAGIALILSDPGIDRAMLRALERALARLGPAKARRVGQSCVVPAWPHIFRAIAAEPGIEQVVVRVPVVRPRALATLAFAPAAVEGAGPLALVLGRLGTWLGQRPFGHDGKLTRWRDRAARAALVARRKFRGTRPAPSEALEPSPQEGGDWEGIFATENPWHYDNTYETAKYHRTLALLPEGRIGRALELACAEGHFTRHLAPRVAHLTASDISPTALGRCRQRCGDEGIANVDFLELDFFDTTFGQDWDLIVSSEVLYYMASRGRLARYADRVASALVEGGHFLHAHAYQVSDTPGRSGFDWGDAFAAGTISETFGAHPALERVSAVESELYRIELYRKRAEGAEAKVHAQPQVISMRDELNAELEADVVWNGPVATRGHVDAERATRLPVLMYHDIAEAGPAGLAPWRTSPEAFEHQLRFLRRRGYRSVKMDEWDHARSHGGALAGRPILITFDDGLASFADTAWPILQRNGFGAHVFIVTGDAGATSAWDRWHGPPARLMDWDRIAALASEGVEFGSHFHEHRPLDRYGPGALYDLACRSRELFAARLGHAPDTIAPPYGMVRSAEAEVLRLAGFRRVFLADGTLAPVVGPRLATPRIEIAGGTDIAAFAEAIGACDAPQPEDRP